MTVRPSVVTARPSRNAPVATAAEWAQRNPSKLSHYRGKWVAISRAGLVAHSDDFDSVFLFARQKGVDNPLVFKVPLSDKPKVVSAKR